ncbi:disease resistance protein RML1B-like [Ziziphus jujuba]|uniref:Disease resistance protein RML1B-like n=1 Tax=Ziziphus jujuba TaxID=326968 RepID=A0ABM4A2M1_ZIZJJ|nr:disease resistance protein RML1B-like [Ziziphus jujuba]
MFNLRLLKLHLGNEFFPYGLCKYHSGECRLSLPDGLEPFVSDELKYFQWDTYPLKYLPYFNPENLVQLIMRESQLELLWNEDQPLELVKLEKIDLSFSEHLMQIPNLSRAINLQVLSLKGCSSLVQLPSFFQNLGKLQILNLQYCYNLKDGLENLPINDLNLRECSSLEELPPLPHGLGKLNIGKCERLKSLPELPSSLYDLCAVECSSLEELPPFPGFLDLDIGKCERLKSLPELPSPLLRLYVEECSSIEELPPLPHRLGELDIGKCERLKSIAELPSSLKVLKANDCTLLETISSGGYATPQKIYHARPFFSFENCIKLDDNTLNKVIADHVHHRISSAVDDALYMYPGDEIPEWFSYQTGSQDSINIHLPPNWFKLELRFAICFVYGYYNQLIDVEYEVNFKGKTSNGDDLLYKHGCAFIELDGSIIDSDHVSIVTQPHRHGGFFWPISDDELLEVFGPNWSSICRNITEASFRVFHEDQNGVIMNIKKFGIHPLNNGLEEPNVDGDSRYQHNHDSHPHNISKRIKLKR